MAQPPDRTESWQHELVRSAPRRYAAVEEVKKRELVERSVEEWQRIAYEMLTFPRGWEPPVSTWSGLVEQQAVFKRARR